MKHPGLILIGAGGHAGACVDVVERLGTYSIKGLVGVEAEVGSIRWGYPVVAFDGDLNKLSKSCRFALIATGQIGSAENRKRLYYLALASRFKLPAIVSPLAHVSRHAIIGAGTIVMHGAIINAGAKIGENCIINTRALLEHDAIVGDHCHISTAAVLNGGVHVGQGGFVGSCSVIKEGITLGRECVVGMGLSVRHSLPDNTRFIDKKV